MRPISSNSAPPESSGAAAASGPTGSPGTEAAEWRGVAAEQRRLDHRLEQELRQALAQGGLLLEYQPRVALGSGRIVGAEALLRWPHRNRGTVPPVVFLALAERSELILGIGAWVLQAACAEAMRWPTALRVSVNIAAQQVRAGVLLAQVAAALSGSALAPERLELELPEAVLADADFDLDLSLAALRDIGVSLAVDNFGAVSGMLGPLRRLPLSTVKLDRSLVRDLPASVEDAAIVTAITGVSHALGLAVVGQAIETAGQRDFLAQLGCEEGQGYLLGHPAPPDRLRSL